MLGQMAADVLIMYPALLKSISLCPDESDSGNFFSFPFPVSFLSQITCIPGLVAHAPSSKLIAQYPQKCVSLTSA